MSSRNSLLSGHRPDTAEIWKNKDVRDRLSHIDFLPAHFKNHGYHTAGMGKIFHSEWIDENSWVEPNWKPANAPYECRTVAGRALVKTIRQEAIASGKPDPYEGIPEKIWRGMPYESLDVEDNELGDGQIADHAVATLQQIKDKPFFLGVGFVRPHLPFVAPQKYWAMYDPEKIQLANNPLAPKGAPPTALHNSSELRTQYVGVPKNGPVDAHLARKLIHGYYACVSYVDAQIGRVLDELDRLELTDNTIVVLCGDHGWHLGDHGMWCKHSNFETATRTPLIISAPGMKARGTKSSSLVELVGIYPTLCELAVLPQPDHLEGSSFAALLENPNLELRRTALSQYPRDEVMGYSLRSDRYRYTEWRDHENGKIRARELYDHEHDPGENTNAIYDAQHSQAITDLATLLDQALTHGRFE
jgi:iduronate 2-sulfatase